MYNMLFHLKYSGSNQRKTKTVLDDCGLSVIMQWRCACWLRDWSLITGRGGLQNGKIAGPKPFAPLSRQCKTFCAPPFNEWKLFASPFNIAKTSSYHLKTTPKPFAPPHSQDRVKLLAPHLLMSENFLRPPLIWLKL